MLLDTNVVSEVMRPRPDPAVVAWLDQSPAYVLRISSITVAEVLLGIELLPEGVRRTRLHAAFVALLERGFAGRILGFDAAAASVYGEICALRRRVGRPIAPLDAQIACIARVNDLPVVTRNVSDFDDCGVEVIDPFAAST